MSGQTHYGVCRIMLHLSGLDIAPVLGSLLIAARDSIDSERDISILGEDLVGSCEMLLRSQDQWMSTQNEYKVFLSQAEAANYLTGLVADSGARFRTELFTGDPTDVSQPLSLPVTSNLVVMIEVIYEGNSPELETSLSTIPALLQALKQLIELRSRNKLREIYVHCSPARLGDELTMSNVENFFPELICL